MRLALILLLAVGLTACQPARVEPFDPFHLAKVEAPKDARAPLGGRLTDQQGRSVTLAELARGRPVVLAPVQYRCPNLCGLTLAGLDQAVAALHDREFALVALGIDPRETPADARAALAPIKTPMAALTGPSKAITDALGYRFAWDGRLYQYAHVSAVAVLASDGRLVRWLPGPKIDAAALRQSLDEAHGAPPVKLPEQLLLLCYHLAPRGLANDRAVLLSLRLAGLATALALLLLIGALVLRQHRRGSA